MSASDSVGAAPGLDAEPARPRAAERILFVASAGGHITELHRLSERIPFTQDSVWVTFDGEQTRSMLAGRTAVFIPYIAPRDALGVLRAIGPLLALLRSGAYDRVVSTGSAIAVSAFVAARLASVPATYIESVARIDGPSLTGRIVGMLRLAELRMQHGGWRRPGWTSWPSVLEQYSLLRPVAPVPADRPLKLFVTLGTIRPYRFDAVVDAVLRSGIADEHAVWQLGSTDRDDLPGTAVAQLPFGEFQRRALEADVVITHAGVGSVIDLLDLGIDPVVVPRRRRRGEHVDDHQEQIAEHLRALGVVTVVDAEALTGHDLRVAAARRAAVTR